MGYSSEPTTARRLVIWRFLSRVLWMGDPAKRCAFCSIKDMWLTPRNINSLNIDGPVRFSTLNPFDYATRRIVLVPKGVL